MKEELIQKMADSFKLFADKTRIKILVLLSEEAMCVEEIAKNLSMEQSAVSHQLRVLKNGRLVGSRKEGRRVYYSLDDHHVKNILMLEKEHMLEE